MASTFKILGRGCAGQISGSGFVIGPHQVLTNAHVVAGTLSSAVFTPDGQVLYGVVVFWDPDRDIAVLDVPLLDRSPLVAGLVDPGMRGAVIGYPHGGPETAGVALVDGPVELPHHDIYQRPTSTVRSGWRVDAVTRPGNSGGPLVDLDGHVLGIVVLGDFAGTTWVDDYQAIRAEVEAATGRTQTVDDGDCVLTASPSPH